MKKLSVIFLSLLLLLTLTLPAWAGEPGEYVIDQADLLEPDQAEILEARARELTLEYDCGVYLMVVRDYTVFSDGDAQDSAEAIFEALDMGEGEDRDGILLLMSMGERDYGFIVHGYLGNDAFPQNVRLDMEENFLEDFRNDDWYGGFLTYMGDCETYLESNRSGETVRESRISLGSVLVVIGVPGLVALIVCMILKSKMKSARMQTHADAYVVPGSFSLQVQRDLFTHRTVQRTKIQRDSSSSGSSGSSGSSSSSGGFSGSSGKF